MHNRKLIKQKSGAFLQSHNNEPRASRHGPAAPAATSFASTKYSKNSNYLPRTDGRRRPGAFLGNGAKLSFLERGSKYDVVFCGAVCCCSLPQLARFLFHASIVHMRHRAPIQTSGRCYDMLNSPIWIPFPALIGCFWSHIPRSIWWMGVSCGRKYDFYWLYHLKIKIISNFRTKISVKSCIDR